jgi:hypothetical protein
VPADPGVDSGERGVIAPRHQGEQRPQVITGLAGLATTQVTRAP